MKEMRMVQPLSYFEPRYILKPSNKRTGALTMEERQRKIQHYRNKRSKRVWAKRINYNCRKRVADNRSRFKGRFVSKYDSPETLNEPAKQSIKEEASSSNHKPENTKMIFKITHDS